MTHRFPARGEGCDLALRSVGVCLALLGAVASPLRADTGPAVAGLEACDRAMQQILRTTGAPGAALAIAYDGRIVYARGFGFIDRAGSRPVQPDTRFRIASASKPITAALVLRLVEQGRLSLDDRAFRLLNISTPTCAGAARDSRLDSITIHQLLSHSAGWDRGAGRNPFTGGTGLDPVNHGLEIAQALGIPPPASTEALVRYMVGQPLQFTPGSASVYSNLGFLVLGQLIEQKTGKRYDEAVREFLEPSFISGFKIGGSRRSELTFDDSDYWDGNAYGISAFGEGSVPTPYMYSLPSIAAGGGWCVSAIEYVRFLLALEGTTDTPPLLEPATVRQMRTTQPPSTNYGLGWFTVFPAPNAGSGHPGALPGTWSWGLRRDDGRVQLMALINGFSNISQVSGQIWDSLRPAVEAIRHMPEADLTWTTLGWDAWRLWRFASDASTELGDPDGDGLPNLIEYAAGLDPRTPDRDAAGRLVTTPDGS